MNTKAIVIGGIAIIAIGLIGWWSLDKNSARGSMLPVDQRPMYGDELPQEDSDMPHQEARGGAEARGTITAIDMSGAAADGPFVIEIASESGAYSRIEIPSMGILLCPAKDSITSIDSLSVGQTIEVRGSVYGEAITPCDSADHYLYIVE